MSLPTDLPPKVRLTDADWARIRARTEREMADETADRDDRIAAEVDDGQPA
jgi:hypothetical protein